MKSWERSSKESKESSIHFETTIKMSLATQKWWNQKCKSLKISWLKLKQNLILLPEEMQSALLLHGRLTTVLFTHDGNNLPNERLFRSAQLLFRKILQITWRIRRSHLSIVIRVTWELIHTNDETIIGSKLRLIANPESDLFQNLKSQM